MKIAIETIREDGVINNCIIEMPNDFLTLDKFDDKYDNLLWERIDEKIDFKGLGYVLNQVPKEV